MPTAGGCTRRTTPEKSLYPPAGFEHFFREVAELIAAGPVAEGQGGDLAQRYGLEFGEPDWLPDVISRYGLTPG